MSEVSRGAQIRNCYECEKSGVYEHGGEVVKKGRQIVLPLFK